jgi:O-succinylbenzoate synthase
VPQLLGAAGPTISINALVPADETDAAAEARRLAARGFRAVKVKVGGGDLETDVRRVRAVAGALGPAVRLRLDANRAWTPAEAVSFFEALGGVPIEYIEEPLADPEALPSFAAETGRPVALDETTREHGPAVLEALAPVAAVVLKPTLLGGLAATREWARAAREHDAMPVVSAAYESGVGLRLLAAQAAALSDAPAGLSTYARLADDVLSPRLPLDGPSAPLDRLFEGTVDETHLDRLHSAH